MKKPINADFFIDMFNIYSVKLLDTTIPIVRDNRNDAVVESEIFDDGRVTVRYNSRKMGSLCKAELLACVFHEIRHIQQGILPYVTAEQKITQELDAETYALKMLNEYYPESLSVYIKVFKARLHRYDYKKKYSEHYKAFIQLKEYNKEG